MRWWHDFCGSGMPGRNAAGKRDFPHGNHSEHCLARYRGRVDPLIEHSQVDALLLKLLPDRPASARSGDGLSKLS